MYPPGFPGIPPIDPPGGVTPPGLIAVTGFPSLLVATIGLGLIFAGFLALRLSKINAAKRASA